MEGNRLPDKLLPKIWGIWEPNIDGSSGTLTINRNETKIEFEGITISDYIDFINDLQSDLGQAKNLVTRMGISI